MTVPTSHRGVDPHMSTMTLPSPHHLFVLLNSDSSDLKQREHTITQLQQSVEGDRPIWLQINTEQFWISWRKNYSPIIGIQAIDDATIWSKYPMASSPKPLTYQTLSEDDFAFIRENASFRLIYEPKESPFDTPPPSTLLTMESPMRFTFRMAQFPPHSLGHDEPTAEQPVKLEPAINPPPKLKKGRGETCPTCGVKVASDIKRHMRRHLEDDEQEKLMIKCPYEGCDVTKMQKSNLKSHIRAQHTMEHIYCPDDIHCSFRTHDDASMLRHRKRYHSYQPYHRKAGVPATESTSPWKGKKSFLTKSEKSKLLGVDDLDTLPEYIQPWKQTRSNPKVPNIVRKGSGLTIVDHSSSFRERTALPSPSPSSPLHRFAEEVPSPVYARHPETRVDHDFMHTVNRSSLLRLRGRSNPPPPPPSKNIEPPRKFSLSALLHPANTPAYPAVRPESIPANMMEIDAPTMASSPATSYHTGYDMAESLRGYSTEPSSCDSNGNEDRHEWIDLDTSDSESELDAYNAKRSSLSPFSFHCKSDSHGSDPFHDPKSTTASVSTFSLDKQYIRCRYASCNVKLPVNGPVVDEHWKTHHVPGEREAVSREFDFRCSWRLHNGEECSSSPGGSTVRGIHALWRHAMFHYNVPIPCPLGCGRLLTYGSADSVDSHFKKCKNSRC